MKWHRVWEKWAERFILLQTERMKRLPNLQKSIVSKKSIIALFGCLECILSATVAICHFVFFRRTVAISSEPVGDGFHWLRISSGFSSMKLRTIDSAYTPISSIAPPASSILKKGKWYS